MHNIVIRQRFSHETSGDLAEVTRIFCIDKKVYVEVNHTGDASEATIMTAVNDALDEYEKKHGTQRASKENSDIGNSRGA